MRITLISPYHGGSHQAWAEGFQQHSVHDVDLLTLPDRFWKWRMHGGAVTLARRFLANGRYPDLILADDMLDLTTFLALTRRHTAGIPVVLYMHENQLTYPLPADETIGPMRRQRGERDQHYVFINYASMLAADAVVFNSQYHLDSWFEALPNYLKHFPEYNELHSIEKLKAKSRVLPVGINFSRFDPPPNNTSSSFSTQQASLPPLILWNQRWEYDKNPDDFFAALTAVSVENIPFRLALCGQQYGKRPFIFESALETLADHIIHVGHADRETYRQLLWEADLVISTAHHEFFGISILEAIYCETFPLLPKRLSYPELIPEAHHADCLYESQQDLIRLLKQYLQSPNRMEANKMALKTAVSHFNWPQIASTYDPFFSHISSSWGDERTGTAHLI
ncbi:MAG: glycosyl transferase family 1 [Chloroflexi bacterium]|nr:MAG: glycosyl transferase family 1 [Chloroflexota bacterium]